MLVKEVLWNFLVYLEYAELQYIPRNMHTVFALLCFVVVIHWLIFPYSSGLLHWHCGNLTIAQVPAKQPWWIWIKTSCEFIMNDCITTTKQSTTKPCAYFLGYIVHCIFVILNISSANLLHYCNVMTPCCSIWSWSPMLCEKHGPRDSVDKNRGRRPRFLSLLRPEGHVFHTAWETMIKCYYSTLAVWFFSMFYSHKYEF